MLRLLPIPAFALLMLYACRDQPQSAAPALSDAAGHARMIALLDSIARNASPVDCYNLNSRMAAMIEPQLVNISDPAQRVGVQFKLAEQLLYAGKNEAATMQLQEIAGMFNNQMSTGNKLVYEFLALSYMRLGEAQNCISTAGTAQSCIVPVQGEGIYRQKSGPENAIAIYENILKQFPDDLDSRWLLNIAYMNLGQYPGGVPKQYLIPPAVFRKADGPAFRNVAIPTGLNVTGLSGGVCMEDFDNDGDLDLFMTSYGLSDPCRYFRNNGDGSFSDQTREAHLDGIVSGLNTVHADYDNDGDADILVLRGGWLDGGTHPNSLLRNNGDGSFTDVTIKAGLLSFHPTQAASWADYDGDGWLDLYIANESKKGKAQHPNELYHNNGDGTFTNVAGKLGLALEGFYKAAVWGDINNDQRPDLYLSNLSGENKLLVNRGGTAPDQWTFEDISAKAGVVNPLKSFPAWFFDYNNDGFDDILVCGYNLAADNTALRELVAEYLGTPAPGDHLRLYRNNGDETFTDVHQQMGLHKVNFAMGCNFGDLDNDGWPDFYLATGLPDLRGLMPNRMFRNRDGASFEEWTMNGFGHLQKGHGVAFGDLDNDGDQDIYAVQGGAYEGDLGNNILFENPGNANHWITLQLEGKSSNRSAIGARVAVHATLKDGNRRVVYARVNTGASFGAASLQQEIGLGAAARIDKIEVWWPAPGTPKAEYTDVPLNSRVRIVEGNSQVEIVASPGFSLKNM